MEYLFKGEVGREKHEISTNRLFVDSRQAKSKPSTVEGEGEKQIDFLFVVPGGEIR